MRTPQERGDACERLLVRVEVEPRIAVSDGFLIGVGHADRLEHEQAAGSYEFEFCRVAFVAAGFFPRRPQAIA
jgi:hypothetical protein